MDTSDKCNHQELLRKINEREISEKVTVESTTHETLQKLCLPVHNLPLKCRTLLKEAADFQVARNTPLDSVTLNLHITDVALRQMKDEEEILLLNQKNETLEDRIQKNKEEIERWKAELSYARATLAKQDPSPDTAVNEIQLTRQKVSSYKQSCEKTKTKFSSLSVPPEYNPSTLEALIIRLEALRAEEASIKERADLILLARSAKQKLMQIKSGRFN